MGLFSSKKSRQSGYGFQKYSQGGAGLHDSNDAVSDHYRRALSPSINDTRTNSLNVSSQAAAAAIMAHPPTKVQYIYKPIEPQSRTMSMTSSPYSQRVTDRGSPSGRSNSMMGLRTMSLSNSHTGLRGPNPAHNAPINGVPRTSSILSDSSPRGNKSSSLINNASTLRKPSLTNVTPLRNSSLTNSITGRNRLGAVRANSLSSLNSNGSAGGKYIVKTTKTTDGQGRTTSITKKTMQQLPNGSVSVLKTETTTFEHIEEEEEVFDEYNFGEDFDGSYDQDTYVPEGYAQDDYEYDTHTPQLSPVRAFQQLSPLLNSPPRPLADLSEVSEEEVVVPRIRRTPENTNGLIIAGGHHVPSHKSLIPVKSILKKPEPVLEESPNIVPNGVFKAKEVATSPVPQTVSDKVDGNKVAPYASLGEPNPKSRSNDTDSTLTEPNDSVPNVKAQTEMTAANFSSPASPLLENSFPGALRDRDVPCSSRSSSMSSEFADALEEPAKYQPTLQVPEAVLRTGSIDGSSSVESSTYKRSESTPPSGDEATALSKKQDKEELKKTVKKAHSDGIQPRMNSLGSSREKTIFFPMAPFGSEILPRTNSLSSSIKKASFSPMTSLGKPISDKPSQLQSSPKALTDEEMYAAALKVAMTRVYGDTPPSAAVVKMLAERQPVREWDSEGDIEAESIRKVTAENTLAPSRISAEVPKKGRTFSLNGGFSFKKRSESDALKTTEDAALSDSTTKEATAVPKATGYLGTEFNGFPAYSMRNGAALKKEQEKEKKEKERLAKGLKEAEVRERKKEKERQDAERKASKKEAKNQKVLAEKEAKKERERVERDSKVQKKLERKLQKLNNTEKLDVPSEPSLSRRAASVSTDRSNAEATPVTSLDQEITPTTSSAPPEGAPLDHISKPTSLPQKDSLRSSLAPARPRFIPPVQNGTLASSKLVNHDALHPEQLKTLVPDTYPSPATPDVCQPSVAKATVQTPFLFAGCGSDPASPTATTHDTSDETFESYQREPIPVDAAPKKEPALKEKPRSKFKKFMNLFVTDYH